MKKPATTPAPETLSVSWGRDYAYPASVIRWEFSIFNGEKLVTRSGGFPNPATARNAGCKRAAEMLENPERFLPPACICGAAHVNASLPVCDDCWELVPLRIQTVILDNPGRREEARALFTALRKISRP